jgi:hypothetical protein
VQVSGRSRRSWTVARSALGGRPRDHGSAHVTVVRVKRLSEAPAGAWRAGDVPGTLRQGLASPAVGSWWRRGSASRRALSSRPMTRSWVKGEQVPVDVGGDLHRAVAQPAAHLQEVGAHRHPQRYGRVAKTVKPHRGERRFARGVIQAPLVPIGRIEAWEWSGLPNIGVRRSSVVGDNNPVG